MDAFAIFLGLGIGRASDRCTDGERTITGATIGAGAAVAGPLGAVELLSAVRDQRRAVHTASLQNLLERQTGLSLGRWSAYQLRNLVQQP